MWRDRDREREEKKRRERRVAHRIYDNILKNI